MLPNSTLHIYHIIEPITLLPAKHLCKLCLHLLTLKYNHVCEDRQYSSSTLIVEKALQLFSLHSKENTALWLARQAVGSEVKRQRGLNIPTSLGHT